MSRSPTRLAWYRLRATLDRRLAGYLALAILVGLIGGVAMASVTAARRTDSAYPDYLASTNPSDLIIQPNTTLTGAETVAQAYRRYEQLLSAVPDPVVPAASIALAAVAALVLANLVAAVPGRQAARTPAALKPRRSRRSGPRRSRSPCSG